ncbi:MAG: methylmalonyl-CoA mutase, partial [Anaerolineae bacterium]|nr:methylmalonyl-CoA mutase [Anaerolineae bacterium]
EEAVTIAMRTQQIIAHESGAANTIDPLGGSYFVEALTNELEAEAYDYFRKIDAMGGMIPALEHGYIQNEIANSAYRHAQEVDKDERIIVGINEFKSDDPIKIPILEMDPQGYEKQVARLQQLRMNRDNEKVAQTLQALCEVCHKQENVMPYLLECARAYCTLQEITDVFRREFGVYRGPETI